MPLLTTLLLLRIRHLVPLGLRISTHPTTGMEMVELQRVMYPKKKHRNYKRLMDSIGSKNNNQRRLGYRKVWIRRQSARL
jgi:hypothetical protein